MMPARPWLSGLHHVGVHSPDPARLLDFYRAVFELRPVPLPSGQTRAFAYFEFGNGSALEVIPAEAPGTEHVGFAVPDHDVLILLRDRLLAAGYRAGEVHEVDALCYFDYHDPDGRRGQLLWPRPQPSVRP